MQQILLVEDSEQCQKIAIRALAHCQVHCVGTVDDALKFLQTNHVDLILLDIQLPKRSGYSLLSDLHGRNDLAEIPVICLTGKSDVTDKVTAFSLGADDYLSKPFDPLELRARVDGRLAKRQRAKSEIEVFTVGAFSIDVQRHRVDVQSDGRSAKVDLTQTEFKLLNCLAKHPERVYTRDQLLVAAWGEDASVLDRAVDVHLCGLRKKLGKHATAIQAVPGVGYRFSLEAGSDTQGKKRKAA